MKKWDYENEQWTQLPTYLKHLPLFTRHFDFTSWIFRCLWGIYIKLIAFRFYIPVTVKGADVHQLTKTHPRLLVISNHSSHLDAVSITYIVPFLYWTNLYITAAKDYWFSNNFFTFFSKHCLGAIPIDRKDQTREAVQLCTNLLKNLDRIWLILFPEGTRSPDGYIKTFKKGVALFAEKTDTPILFLYIEGNAGLWPKGRLIPLPGKLTIHIGPVQPPASIGEINKNYRKWVETINSNAYADTSESEEDGKNHLNKGAGVG